MASLVTAATLLLTFQSAIGNDDDRFTYKFRSSMQDGRQWGIKEWDEVECTNLGQCLGWPDVYESRRSFNLTDNHCRWCPKSGDPNCTHHRQSPVNLERNKGIKNHENEKSCKDSHWMAYLPGSCKWNDIIDNDSALLRNNFVIDRHALQIMQPVNATGKLQCGRRKFPRIDYAFGFPEWWLLYQTEIKTPSEHRQETKQYDAEIQLDHVYQVNRRQREIGKVAIFLDGNNTVERWDFLDKMICQWREVEDATRKACCLPSVPPYPGCRNPYRPYSIGCTPTALSGATLFGSDVQETDGLTATMTASNVPLTTTQPSGRGEFMRTGENTQTTTSVATSTGIVRTTYVHNTTTVSSSELSQTATLEPDTTSTSTRTITSKTTTEAVHSTAEPGSIISTQERVKSKVLPSTVTAGTTVESQTTMAREPRTTAASTVTTHRGTVEPETKHTTTDSATITATSSDPVPTTALKVGTGANDETFSCKAYADVAHVNYGRMCKDGGCCEIPRQDGRFCHKMYDFFGIDMSTACHECCDPPRTVGPPTPDHPSYDRIQCSSIPDDTARMCKPDGCCDGSGGAWCQELRYRYTNDKMRSICWYCCSEPRDIGQQRELHSTNDGLGETNDVSREDNVDASQRHLSSLNYKQVPYHAYEWMNKVKTEYYFRYVGSQTVPPCFTRVHWRVMKDPIQVHPIQIKELQRLLAWRIAPPGSKFDECQADTAGRPVPGSNGNIVQVNRPLQAENELHQMTFCECKDWVSKSLDDQAWCNISNVQERFYDHPYSFDTNGDW